MKKFLSVVLMLAMALCALSAVAEWDASKAIAVVSREEGSGTRGAFVELTKVEAKNDKGEKIDHTYEEAIIANNTATVLTTVAGNEYAIGYASMASVEGNDTVKALKVAGVEATTENILNKTYSIARPFNIVTKGELTDELAKDFYAFIMSKEGQQVITENKAISVATDATPSYKAAGLKGKLVVGGSSSVSPVMEKLKEAYVALNPDADIELQTTDSTSGVTNALNGTYGIGMASRELKDSEVKNGAVGTVIAMDGICVVVHPANPTDSVELEQVRQIFVGEVTTWENLAKK